MTLPSHASTLVVVVTMLLASCAEGVDEGAEPAKHRSTTFDAVATSTAAKQNQTTSASGSRAMAGAGSSFSPDAATASDAAADPDADGAAAEPDLTAESVADDSGPLGLPPSGPMAGAEWGLLGCDGGTVDAAAPAGVEPMLRRGAELFLDRCPGVVFTIDRLDNDESVGRLCAGLLDVAVVTRQPIAEERWRCDRADIDLFELAPNDSTGFASPNASMATTPQLILYRIIGADGSDDADGAVMAFVAYLLTIIASKGG